MENLYFCQDGSLYELEGEKFKPVPHKETKSSFGQILAAFFEFDTPKARLLDYFTPNEASALLELYHSTAIVEREHIPFFAKLYGRDTYQAEIADKQNQQISSEILAGAFPKQHRT